MTRVENLDIDDETKGKAISVIYLMPKEDREGFVSSRPTVAKSTILARLSGGLKRMHAAWRVQNSCLQTDALPCDP